MDKKDKQILDFLSQGSDNLNSDITALPRKLAKKRHRTGYFIRCAAAAACICLALALTIFSTLNRHESVSISSLTEDYTTAKNLAEQNGILFFDNNIEGDVEVNRFWGVDGIIYSLTNNGDSIVVRAEPQTPETKIQTYSDLYSFYVISGVSVQVRVLPEGLYWANFSYDNKIYTITGNTSSMEAFLYYLESLITD